MMLSVASTVFQPNYCLLSVMSVNMIMNLSRIFQGRNKLLKKVVYELHSLQASVYKEENPAKYYKSNKDLYLLFFPLLLNLLG